MLVPLAGGGTGGRSCVWAGFGIAGADGAGGVGCGGNGACAAGFASTRDFTLLPGRNKSAGAGEGVGESLIVVLGAFEVGAASVTTGVGPEWTEDVGSSYPVPPGI